jgi:cellulose synthase operon protein YhjU
MTMGLWSIYFFEKLYLHYRGFIRFDVLANLLFLIFIVLPLPKQFRDRRLITLARQTVNVVIALLLLWHDSWLPDPLHALRMLRENGMPSGEYLLQFFLRLWSPGELLVLAGIMLFSFLVRNFRKTAAAGTAVLLLLPLVVTSGGAGRKSGAEVEQALGSFINAESTKHLRVAPPAAEGPGFDILILQICSLAWDDLHELGMEDHPFFKQFDLLFTNFNSVTSYSNPAAIRLLNADCGQRRHADLYTALPRECSLMDGLHARGYALRYARNHNGTYGKFDEEVRTLGHLAATPFMPQGLVAKKFMFDDSPVYDDRDLLEQWWTARQRAGEKKVALYYNSVSLHDGSHWISDREWWKRGHRGEYREFLQTLLAELTQFFDTLAASKRDVVVVVLGEHGRALRGNAIETPGLRDIPLPRITLVPVGLKLIGKKHNQGPSGRSVMIDKAASYFELASVLNAFAEESPFTSDRYTTRAFIDSIPQTPFVAENENNLVVRYDDEYYFYGKDRAWIRLSEEALK